MTRKKNPIVIGRNPETNTKSSTENNTESNPINPINLEEAVDKSCEKEIDGMDGTVNNRSSCRQMLEKRIDWSAVIVENRCNPDLVDEILELMLDVMVSKKGTFRINGEEIATYDLQLRFMKLKTDHIQPYITHMGPWNNRGSAGFGTICMGRNRCRRRTKGTHRAWRVLLLNIYYYFFWGWSSEKSFLMNHL